MAMLTSVRRRRSTKRLSPAAIPAQRHLAAITLDALAAEPTSIGSDLALNQPGKAAREQALLRRQVAPVRAAVARAFRVPSNERAWRRDADGEAKVAAMLAQLDDRWRVLHAVPLRAGSATIDHVVIGPAGVYCLSTRHHPGGSVLVAGDLFMVDGRRYAYTAAARRLAAEAKDKLSAACGFAVAVNAVVVPVGADDFLIKRQPADVGIVTRARLSRWLGEQAEVLQPHNIEEIYAAARRSNVWE